MACSPSLGLLLRRAEHSAVPACAQARLDARRDEPVPEAAHLGLHRGGAVLPTPCELDAWVGARPDVAADVARPFRALLADAGAGRSVDPEPDDRVPDACLPARLAQAEPDAAVVPCKQGVARSAEQSCAGRVVGVWRQPAESPDAAHSTEALRARGKQSSKAVPEHAELRLGLEVVPQAQDARVALPPRGQLEERAAQWVQQVSRPQVQQSPDA